MSVAVFAGNILYSLACEAMALSSFPPEKKRSVLDLLISEYREVNESQLLDLWFEHTSPGVEEWYAMASKRASSLFRTTLLTGAILAGSSEHERNILSECSRHIGLSFDIQDDIIGTFATEEQYGRPTDGDIRAGKKHLHVLYALQSDESDALMNILGKKDATEQEVDRARGVMRKHGLEKAKQRSFEHAEQAVKLIDTSNLGSESREFFRGFISFVSQSLEWYK
jgi:geranylgeranyl pyrophosphate synthase